MRMPLTCARPRPPQVVLLWFLFMFLLQIVLLNLLIAIMADTHSRVYGVAQLVALAERARLILAYEEQLQLDKKASHLHPAQPATGGSALARNVLRAIPKPAAWLLRYVALGVQPTAEQATPRWLHVLMPADANVKPGTASRATATPGAAADSALDELRRQVHLGQQKVIDVVGEAHVSEEAMLSAFRSEIRAEMAALRAQLDAAGGHAEAQASAGGGGGGPSGSLEALRADVSGLREEMSALRLALKARADSA